jgi:hypothetical protein
MTLHGEISLRQSLAPPEPVHDVALEAPRREQRRLHDERLDLRAPALVGVDEDHFPVRPGRLTRLAWRNLKRPLRDRRG